MGGVPMGGDPLGGVPLGNAPLGSAPLAGEPPHGAAPAAGAELRGAPRFTLVLRTARLVADGREYLCVLRDISATGVKIKLFHALPACAALQLELDGGERHDMLVAWVTADHAGLRFAEPIGPTAALAGSSYPRRPLRIHVDQPAVLLVHGEALPATLVDLSQQGACIETAVHLRLRERCRIKSEQMGEMSATVCWRERSRYGLVFEQGFKLDQLARLLYGIWHGDASAGAGKNVSNR